MDPKEDDVEPQMILFVLKRLKFKWRCNLPKKICAAAEIPAEMGKQIDFIKKRTIKGPFF